MRCRSWNIGLPATQWTFQLDYTNTSLATDGFRIRVDVSGQEVFSNAVPLYFNDDFGTPLPNGQLVSTAPVTIVPNGMPQVLNLNWLAGNSNFHVRTLRYETESQDVGRYRMPMTSLRYRYVYLSNHSHCDSS